MHHGYSSASSPASWIRPEQFRSVGFLDTDLKKAGLRTLLPWKAESFRAYHCPQCQLLMTDYSRKWSRKAIEASDDRRA